MFKALHRSKVLVLSTHGFFLPDQEVEHKDEQSVGLTSTATHRPWVNISRRIASSMAGPKGFSPFCDAGFRASGKAVRSDANARS